jgi:hypothetical protein
MPDAGYRIPESGIWHPASGIRLAQLSALGIRVEAE